MAWVLHFKTAMRPLLLAILAIFISVESQASLKCRDMLSNPLYQGIPPAFELYLKHLDRFDKSDEFNWTLKALESTLNTLPPKPERLGLLERLSHRLRTMFADSFSDYQKVETEKIEAYFKAQELIREGDSLVLSIHIDGLAYLNTEGQVDEKGRPLAGHRLRGYSEALSSVTAAVIYFLDKKMKLPEARYKLARIELSTLNETVKNTLEKRGFRVKASRPPGAGTEQMSYEYWSLSLEIE